MRRILLAWVIAFTGPLSAATMFVSGGAPAVVDVPGIDVNWCQQESNSSASCTISFSVRDGRSTVFSTLQAGGSFGSVSASIFAGVGNYGISALARGSFSDYLIITGAEGTGTLVSHYELMATKDAFSGPSLTNPSYLAFAAGYRFIQGATQVQRSADPTVAHPEIPVAVNYAASFDVSSPFSFGVPLPFAAGTFEQLDPLFFSACGRSCGYNLSSGLTLTGFSVLDSSGNAIDAAQVTREFVTGPDVFLPEPGGGALVALGIAMLLARRKR